MDPNAALDQLAYLYEDEQAGTLTRDQIFAVEEYASSLASWVTRGGFLPAFVTEPQPWTTDPNRWSAWTQWVLPEIDWEARARIE
jgi:hypothetical protein